VVQIIFTNIFSDIFLFYKKLVKQFFIIGKNDILNVGNFPSVLILFPRECIGPRAAKNVPRECFFLGERDFPMKCVKGLYGKGCFPSKLSLENVP
jgi:hypothetical protein